MACPASPVVGDGMCTVDRARLLPTFMGKHPKRLLRSFSPSTYTARIESWRSYTTTNEPCLMMSSSSVPERSIVMPVHTCVNAVEQMSLLQSGMHHSLVKVWWALRGQSRLVCGALLYSNRCYLLKADGNNGTYRSSCCWGWSRAAVQTADDIGETKRHVTPMHITHNRSSKHARRLWRTRCTICRA